MAKALFVTTKDIKRYSVLSGSVDPDKFIYMVEISMDTEVQNFMGTKLYDKVNADMIAGTLTGDYLDLVNVYLKPIVIHLTFLEFLPFSQYTISNNGVFKKSSENSETPSLKEMDRMKDAAKDTADHYITRFIQYMRHNAHDKFPEYLTTNHEEMKPQKDISFGNWQI